MSTPESEERPNFESQHAPRSASLSLAGNATSTRLYCYTAYLYAFELPRREPPPARADKQVGRRRAAQSWGWRTLNLIQQSSSAYPGPAHRLQQPAASQLIANSLDLNLLSKFDTRRPSSVACDRACGKGLESKRRCAFTATLGIHPRFPGVVCEVLVPVCCKILLHLRSPIWRAVISCWSGVVWGGGCRLSGCGVGGCRSGSGVTAPVVGGDGF